MSKNNKMHYGLYILGLLLMSKITVAVELSDCDKAYQDVEDPKKFATFKSKLEYLKKFEDKCGGTGLYETRLGYLYAESGDLVAAEDTLKKGLLKKNDFQENIKFSLIDIQVKKGQLDDAFANAIKLKNEYPNSYYAYLLLADITLEQKRFEDSIHYAIESNKRHPVAGTYIGMTIAYHQLKMDVEAVNAAVEAIRLDNSVVAKGPGMNEAIYSLVRLNRYKDAESFAETRMKNDNSWSQDAVFLKSVNFLKSKGFLKN